MTAPQRQPLSQLDLNAITAPALRSNKLMPVRPKRTLQDLIKPLKPYKLPPPRVKCCVVLSPRRKIEIIMYFLHHRIKADPSVPRYRCMDGLTWDDWMRPPTSKEVSQHFLVPERTIRNIWAECCKILKGVRSQQRAVTQPGALEELELELF